MRFETEQDRERQHSAVRAFCYNYGLVEVDMGEFAKTDYKLRNKKGETVGLFEVKGAPNQNIESYDTSAVALKKIAALQELQKMSGVPCVICWAFDDGIAFERINNLEGSFKLSGREKREGSTYDEEILVFVDRKNLKKIWY